MFAHPRSNEPSIRRPDPFRSVSQALGSVQVSPFEVIPIECSGDYTYFGEHPRASTTAHRRRHLRLCRMHVPSDSYSTPSLTTPIDTVLGSTLTPLLLCVSCFCLAGIYVGGNWVTAARGPSGQAVIYVMYTVLPSTSRVLFKFLICETEPFDDGGNQLSLDFNI